MKLVFAVLEDDKELLRFYKAEIAAILGKCGIEGEVACAVDNPEQFIEVLKKGNINVCIVDINLKGNANGMQVAKVIRQMKIPVEVIFITGHLQYMKNAFEVRAFDYLEKPVTVEDLERCIKRVYKEMDVGLHTRQDVVKIKSGTVIYHVPVNDIFYIEHSGFKTVLLTKDRRIETYETLANVAKELPEGHFKQCHRAIWVNLEYIMAVDYNQNTIQLKNGMQCSLGKTFRKEFTQYEN